ncbi:unnamed protein product, partial [Iphiclides podalirius]
MMTGVSGSGLSDSGLSVCDAFPRAVNVFARICAVTDASGKLPEPPGEEASLLAVYLLYREAVRPRRSANDAVGAAPARQRASLLPNLAPATERR